MDRTNEPSMSYHVLVRTRAVAAALSAYRYSVSTEVELQNAIQEVFEAADIPCLREERLDSRNRPDFVVGGDIAVEVKIGGSVAALARQVARYAECSQINGIVVVSTKCSHDLMPESLSGKPIVFVLARTFM